MMIIDILVAYVITGCLWAFWLEWFCNKHGIGGRFNNGERYMQLLFWPYNFFVFVRAWILTFFGYYDEDDEEGNRSSR